jgi:hypothetical protein
LVRADLHDRILTLWLVGEGLDAYFHTLYQNVWEGSWPP